MTQCGNSSTESVSTKFLGITSRTWTPYEVCVVVNIPDPDGGCRPQSNGNSILVLGTSSGDSRKAGTFIQDHVIDPDVYELHLKGRHIMERGGLQAVRNAIGYFQSGLEKDPDNALLYTGLADAYIDKMMDVHESMAEATSNARAAAEKALQLDDSLAEAPTSLGMIKLAYDWDWPGAEREFKRAMELNPRVIRLLT